MSETALTLIKAALRSIGVIAPGETPTDDEVQDGLEAMKFMFRNWSSQNIKVYSVTVENFTLTGAASYTIGSGGTFNTVRPASIRGAYVRDAYGFDNPLDIIDEAKYRDLHLKSIVAVTGYLWYNPTYPLGTIYLYPLDGSTIYLHSLKPLTDPTIITSSIAFPPEYDEAIKFNLALRLCPEYGKEPSQMVLAFASGSMKDIESKNFAAQINAVKPEVIKIARRYSIDEG
jgi:hypothetical protein